MVYKLHKPHFTMPDDEIKDENSLEELEPVDIDPTKLPLDDEEEGFDAEDLGVDPTADDL